MTEKEAQELSDSLLNFATAIANFVNKSEPDLSARAANKFITATHAKSHFAAEN